MEKCVTERIGYLERHKSVSLHKIAILQKSLERSVSESDLELLNRRFNELTSKYRALLQKESDSESKSIYIDEIREEAEKLKSELRIEKERRILLEETNNKYISIKDKFDDKLNHSLTKKMAVLEMKELNERQKSEHATRMYHKLKSSIDELQKRNSELE